MHVTFVRCHHPACTFCGGCRRPVFGGEAIFHGAAHWRDNLLFYEYFHGDNGAGVGASHQAGWTALVAKIIHERCGDADVGGRC